MPEGINVLWNYICIMVFLFLFILFLSDFSIFFGIVFEGTMAHLLHLIYFTVFLVALFGLTYHKPWVYNFLLWLFYYWSANLFLTFIASSFIENPLAKSYLALFLPIIIMLLVVNLIIIWYLFEKKENFISFTGIYDMVEKVFWHTMVLVCFSIIFLLLFGIIKMAQIPIAKENIEERVDSLDYEVAGFCENKGKYEDICYLLKAKFHCDNYKCLKIEDSFYRFLCMNLDGLNGK